MPSHAEIQDLIERSLKEDLREGDITTRALVPEDQIQEARVAAKAPLVLCGGPILKEVFIRLDPTADFPGPFAEDGAALAPGETICRIRARAVSLLEGERVALNIVQRLSGIATLTRKFVERARPVTVLDTRKTTPGLRAFEKYAVRCGGGTNHRYGLFDAVLIKDNHIMAAGGILQAVTRVRQKYGTTQTIEVETRSLDEVDEALQAEADIIMLDNMPTPAIRQAVQRVNGRTKIEVSGNIDLQRLDELAHTGIDFVSVGALTHSAPAADISMNFL